MGESRDFIAFIAKNANEQANLGEIQKKNSQVVTHVGAIPLRGSTKKFS